MAKLSKLFTSIAAILILVLASSCSEHEEAGEFDNWQERNRHYIDSIATEARINADGKWTKIRAYTLSDSQDETDSDNNHYIYVKKIETGNGTYSPLYTDSVRVHYSGRLIPSSTYPKGYNFGKSYSTSVLNEATDVPALMGVSQNIVGFATALMHMVEGDRWEIVIPYYLGYGTTSSTQTGIPGYSALIFDVKLARIYRYQIDTDTSWH
ncbi:MAG: FKBP-type peptidyl-prolyl cis-trans isomerase [Prevotellaceae bacterium]|nr:FKBP-type peptidyl-prolyl cis-trans isomerase [Prevotellaceae bacterium]